MVPTSFARRSRYLSNLNDVVQKGSVNLLEPVRRSLRHDHDVALLELTRLAAVDRAPAKFIRGSHLRVDRFAARDERRATVEHVDDVGVELVDFAHSRSFAPRSVDHVILAVCTAGQNG